MRFLKLVISICRSTGYLVHRSKKRIFRNIASHSQPFFIICSFFAFLVSPLKLTIQMSNFRKQGKFSPTRTSTLKMNFSEVDRFTFSFSNCKTNRLGVVWNIWRREIVKSVLWDSESVWDWPSKDSSLSYFYTSFEWFILWPPNDCGWRTFGANRNEGLKLRKSAF